MPYRWKIRASASAFVAGGILSIGLPGCSFTVEKTSTPTIPAAELQRELTERIKSDDGTPPETVTCANDLVGQVGKTTSCELVMGQNNFVQADLTVTKVDGSRIDFDYSPSLSRDQLERAIKGTTSAESVTCNEGLEGKVGASTHCVIDKDGTTLEKTVSVNKVEGLYMGITDD